MQDLWSQEQHRQVDCRRACRATSGSPGTNSPIGGAERSLARAFIQAAFQDRRKQAGASAADATARGEVRDPAGPAAPPSWIVWIPERERAETGSLEHDACATGAQSSLFKRGEGYCRWLPFCRWGLNHEEAQWFGGHGRHQSRRAVLLGGFGNTSADLIVIEGIPIRSPQEVQGQWRGMVLEKTIRTPIPALLLAERLATPRQTNGEQGLLQVALAGKVEGYWNGRS